MGKKRLFLDDEHIAEMRDLERVLHPPQRHPGNPLMVGAKPWEKWMIEATGRPVLFDEETGAFRMWYVAAWLEEGAPQGYRYLTCYAESVDGLYWEKPALGQFEYEGSTENNIIRCGREWMRRANVIKDSFDADPQRRYKMIYVDFPEPGKGVAFGKAFSADGLRWQGDGRPRWRRRGLLRGSGVCSGRSGWGSDDDGVGL